MQEIVYHKNFELEESYWWFVARNEIVKNTILKRTDLNKGAMVLDVGCGTGGFAKLISDSFTPICMDTSDIALEYCRKRGIKQLHNSILQDFPAEQVDFDAITMLDVIEHIEDDQSVINTAFQISKPNGWFIATVPAYQNMWSWHDEMHHHYRRYSINQITELIKKAGFSVKYASYFNTFLFLPAWLKRKIEKITKETGEGRPPVDEVSPLLNKIFKSVFLLEKPLLEKAALPFGLSIIVLAKKEI